MTNDGDLINRLMRGSEHHEKEYIVKVTKELPEDFKEKMEAGVFLSELNRRTKPCQVEILGKYTFRIILTQGLNRQIRRSSFVKTQIIPREQGDFSVLMSLDDEAGNLMTLELMAPNQRQAVRLGKLFEKKAEAVYNLTMAELLDDEDEIED